MSSLVEVRKGVPGDAQEHSFMNATLQNHGGDEGIAFSIATYVAVPESMTGEDEIATYIEGVLRRAASAVGALTFEVEIGPEDPDR